MGPLATSIDPSSTRMVLTTLSLAIDETRLLREIDSLEKRINLLKRQPAQLSLTQQLIREQTSLIRELDRVRNKADALY